MPEHIPLTINLDSAVEFLIGLLNTPSPTGYTAEAVAYTQTAFEALKIPGLTFSLTRKGALIGHWKGKAKAAPRGVTAHLDTLGLMVREIKPGGRLRPNAIGGIMWGGVEMEGVTVRTFDNRRYRGTVVPANPSVHVNANIRDQKREADWMEIRLDERTRTIAETRGLGIDVGDYIFLDPRVEVTGSGFIRGRFLDDKAGVACVYAALQAMKAAKIKPAQDTYILIANYEEVGHGGSAGWPVELSDLLAIDMGAIGEGQHSDEFSVSICVKDGGGPYHFEFTQALRKLAQQHYIPHKPDIYLYYSSDGTAYWRAGGAARVALIGPGVDCSHSYERTHKDALEHTSHLIARYLMSEEA